MKHTIITFLLLILMNHSFATNYVALTGVNDWGVAASWSPNGIPIAGDNVTIPDGAIMRVNGTAQECSTVFMDCNNTGSGSNATLLVLGGGSLTISGDLTMDEDFALIGLALLNVVSTSTLTVGGDVNMNVFQTTGAKIFMTSGASTFNLAGNFNFAYGTEGSFIVGTTSGSTINFNGSAAQTIPVSVPTFEFYNISTNNAVGATLDAALTSSNFIGSLNVAGGIYNDGGFTSVIPGDLTVAGTYNASADLDIAGNVTISGTFASSGCNINLEGDWGNSGTYSYSDGDNVTFDGTGGQSTITGATDWDVLTCDNSSGVNVALGAQRVHKIFDINDGPFTIGFGSVVLISDASGTAQMDNIDNGSFSGSMTVQRFINKSAQSFTSMSSPVTGTKLSTWQANGVLFSGFTGADVEAFWNNTHWYDEPNHGSVKADGWALADNITNPVGSDNDYKAYYVYMDATPFNLSVTGTPATGGTGVDVSYTASSSADDDGWNLIGNPYPCSVDWDLLYANNSNDVEDIYIAYSGEYANYGYYWGSATSVPAGGVSEGGVTKNIPHSQGFWVKAKSGGDNSLDFLESHKDPTDAVYLKSSSADIFDISLTSNINAFQDHAMIYSEDIYSDLYEDIDIPKFYTMDPNNAPTLYTQSTDGANLALNIIGTNNVSIPLSATAGTNAQGDYTLDFTVPATFMEGACLTLEDLHTGNSIDLRSTTSYTFTTSGTTTVPRFMIHMVRDFNTTVEDLTCFGTTDGEVLIDGSGITGSTFDLLDDSGNSLFNGVAVNDVVQFSNVPAGTYEVTSDYVGACSTGDFFITVEEPVFVSANFDLLQDTVYLDQGGVLEVNNLSSGTNFVWDFGDGNTSTEVNPSNTYTAAGVYQVMLTSDNDNIGSCTQILSKNIIVMNGALSIDELISDDNTNAFISNGKVVVEFDLEDHVDAEISLVDVSGKVITTKERNVSNSRINLISSESLSSGVYFVNITIDGQRHSQKLFVD